MILTGKEGTEYLVGLDLQASFCQISAVNERAARGGIYAGARSDPETLSTSEDEKDSFIPLKVARSRTGSLLLGRDAVSAAQALEIPFADDLMECLREGRPLLLGEESLDPVPVLEAFLSHAFSLFSSRIPLEQIGLLVCTTAFDTPEMREALEKALTGLSLPRERIRIQSHTDSFYYYILMQSRERRPGDSVLCDLTPEGRLGIFTLYFPNRKDASRYEVQEGHWNLPPSDPPSRKDQILFQAFRDMTVLPGVKGQFRTVYLAGDDFLGHWMQQSLRYMGQGRKLFQGSNLYSKGAALSALYELEKEGRTSRDLVRFAPAPAVHLSREEAAPRREKADDRPVQVLKAVQAPLPRKAEPAPSPETEKPEEKPALPGREELMDQGRAYARDFLYEKAARCFQKVFKETGDPEAGALLMASLRMGLPEETYFGYVQRHPELYMASKEAERRIQEADAEYRNGSEARMIRKMRQLKREEKTGELESLIAYRLADAAAQYRSKG